MKWPWPARASLPKSKRNYRKSHPNLNYAQVDQVEKFEVSPAQLQTFQREGGLQ